MWPGHASPLSCHNLSSSFPGEASAGGCLPMLFPSQKHQVQGWHGGGEEEWAKRPQLGFVLFIFLEGEDPVKESD